MCGIAGFLEFPAGRSKEELARIAEGMAETIRYRGPDASGVWSDEASGLALAHRRLSVIDLSAAGNQPMVSSCGRYTMVYNGEVYNCGELRAELAAAGRLEFRGHSDTEVILEGFASWGVRATTERLIGMFAFAVWDRENRQLSLVRDRLGIKPLYWSVQNRRLLFASELKALRAHPDWRAQCDRDALAGFLRFNYIPGPHTVYQNVHKLEPGCLLTLDARHPEKPVITPYWSLEEVARAGCSNPFAGDDTQLLDTLEELIADAVRRRMVADVPLGAFLSGGVDSSTVVALMQREANRPVKTFTIGFGEKGYSEAGHAAAVARHLGTEHTELQVSPQQAMDVIPGLADMYDEPFADPSQIPTYLVSALTREHVTVALSGDGGDELFAGYNRHVQSLKISGGIGRLPLWMRKGGAQLIQCFSPGFWDGLFNLVPASARPSLAGEKMYKLARVIGASDEQFYRQLVSHWDKPGELIAGSSEPRDLQWAPPAGAGELDRVQRLRYLDTRGYLPDDILTKVDRASMAASLEARIPLLDHRLVEFAWRLPTAMLIREGRGKWPLRQVLYRHVPARLVDRPKMGFAVPLDVWLRGPLREWAESLLNPVAIERHGILASAPIQRKWRQHLSAERNWQYHLWNILVLQCWCNRYL